MKNLLLSCVGILVAACAQGNPEVQPIQQPKPEKKETPMPTEKPAKQEPDAIKVQHILIAFDNTLGKPVPRNKEEAKTLAYSLLERARKGEDFGKLVIEFTDDSAPGIYGMTNTGKPRKAGYYARNEMVAAFGDTGFPLALNEIGMADFDPKKSPFGWHIVKRVE